MTEGASLSGTALLAFLWLIPFALLMLTSFVKISVVLSILRSAIGAPDIPPTLVVTGVALVLSALVMAPTASAVAQRIEPTLARGTQASLFSPAGTALVLRAAQDGADPVRDFLVHHSKPEDRALFQELGARLATQPKLPAPKERDLRVLAPAFVISELSHAFRIGVMIFLPFLVIDLVVANLLLAMGLTALSPMVIALPFKLLMFVMVDGWRLVAKGLVLTYT